LNYALRINQMNQRIKRYLLIALAAGALYFVLDNHFIFHGRQVHLLKKTSLNLHQTFVSLNNYKPESLMKIDDLRAAGIGDLLVELEIITEERRDQLQNKYDYE
jgi:hypothetical protein